MMKRLLYLLLLLPLCSNAGQIFLRPSGATSVVLSSICAISIDGTNVVAIDFNTTSLTIVIESANETFTYTGGNIDDGPDSSTWGDPAANAIEVDAETSGCITLHTRDEIWDASGIKEWTIKIDDGESTIMETIAQVLVVDAATDLVDQVWDETRSGHTTAGTFGDIGQSILATGTCDSGSTTTCVDAARTEADDDYWRGAGILFTSGNAIGQTRCITDFAQSSDTLTFPATTAAISTDTYLLFRDPNCGGVPVGTTALP